MEFDTGALNNAGEEQFSPFSGAFAEAQEGLRTKSVESNGNFYFTSSTGIQKISAATASQFSTAPGYIRPAGGVKALDLTATVEREQGNITGFLPQDSTVAYRVVWGYNDANKNLIFGVPSQRAEVYNSLNDLLILDFNNTIQQIQNVADQPSPNNSIISDTDYISTLSLTTGATSDDISTNLIALSSKLDNDILLASATAGPPLTLSGVAIVNSATKTGNVVTLTFSAGTPTNYLQAGSNIYLNAFPVGQNGTSINGLQTVTSVTSTTVSFLSDATGNVGIFNSANVDITNDIITVNSHGFNNKDAVRFVNTGGSLPTPLAVNTTYFIGAVTANTFQVFTSSALGTPVNLTAAGSGTDTVSYFLDPSGTTINSGEFRSIDLPADQDTPATDDELVSLQTYLKNIIQKLQLFPTTGTPPIISSYSEANYITNLSVTTSANVKITITLPDGLTDVDFVQVYRSPVLSATGTTVLSQLIPSDELQQVYEAFPTAAELAAGQLTFVDITPDAFLGASLYTNQASGVGIANANETPPFALDVNRFKNVVFYANTKTKYRMSLNLLGVSEMQTDATAGKTPQLVITTDTSTNIYSFVLGVNNDIQVTMVADTSDSLNGRYFTLWNANNQTQYYIWYKTSGGTTSDPAVAGATGVEVFINTNDSANTVASKTNDAINTLLITDFTSLVSTNNIQVQNSVAGATNNPGAGTSGFTVAVATVGVGQKVEQSSNVFTAQSAAGDNLAGKYFTVSSAFQFHNYYVWYRSSGSGLDPFITGKTGILVDVVAADSATSVATKTAAAINAAVPTVLTTTSSGAAITITSIQSGPSTAGTAGTTGWASPTYTDGALQVLLSDSTSPAQAVDETSRSLVNVINRNEGEILYAFYLSQSTTVPGEMTLESRDLSSTQYYLITNDSNTGSSFNPDLSPSTTNSITGISTDGEVTTANPHGFINGDQIVISGSNSTPPADGLHTVTYLTPTTFSIGKTLLVAANMGKFLNADDTNSGDNDEKINRIYYSRFQQPEAVPLPNTLDVGDADKAILRIFPLRDSLFVFKEEGLYRISGETAPFTLQLFDSSCLLIAPDSLGVTKNIIYSWTTQGILSVTESGVSNPPISRPIDVNILPLNSQKYPNFTSSTWGVGYESDNSYTVFTVSATDDTEATIAYRYSDITQSWTTFDKSDTCGIVNITDDRLYLGAGDTNFIEQERKNYDRFDYADRELSSSLDTDAYFGKILQLPTVAGITEGDVVVQNQDITVYDFNSLLLKLDLDAGLQINSIATITTGSSPTITTTGNHFLTTGDFVTISDTLTTPLIDGTYKVNVLSSNSFSIIVPSPVLTGGSAGEVKYSYYNTLKIGGGINLASAQAILSARLTLEPSLIYKQYSGTIVDNSLANPTVITLTAPHTMGGPGTIRRIRITGNVGSLPNLNGDWDCTVIDSTHVSLPFLALDSGTGGTLATLDDYITSIQGKAGSITNISIHSPTVITSFGHGMVSDRFISVIDTDSSPAIDGNYIATIIDNNHFSIPASVNTTGTDGLWATLNGTLEDVLVNYNYIISILNKDTGTTFKNYKQISGSTSQEAIIVSVNKVTKQITLAGDLPWVVGPLSIFKAIESTFTYAPCTFKDTLNLKQVSEATLMFENKAFSTGTLSFKSDLVPNFKDVSFNANGNGAFGIGTGPFGGNFFGGGANAAPFRTYIPRDIQRCRYIIPKFTHKIALEKYIINGLTLSGTIGQSTRAYR